MFTEIFGNISDDMTGRVTPLDSIVDGSAAQSKGSLHHNWNVPQKYQQTCVFFVERI